MKWIYEQHLYTHTLKPIINRFASTNEPLNVWNSRITLRMYLIICLCGWKWETAFRFRSCFFECLKTNSEYNNFSIWWSNSCRCEYKFFIFTVVSHRIFEIRVKLIGIKHLQKGTFYIVFFWCQRVAVLLIKWFHFHLSFQTQSVEGTRLVFRSRFFTPAGLHLRFIPPQQIDPTIFLELDEKLADSHVVLSVNCVLLCGTIILLVIMRKIDKKDKEKVCHIYICSTYFWHLNNVHIFSHKICSNVVIYMYGKVVLTMPYQLSSKNIILSIKDHALVTHRC